MGRIRGVTPTPGAVVISGRLAFVSVPPKVMKKNLGEPGLGVVTFTDPPTAPMVGRASRAAVMSAPRVAELMFTATDWGEPLKDIVNVPLAPRTVSDCTSGPLLPRARELR